MTLRNFPGLRKSTNVTRPRSALLSSTVCGPRRSCFGEISTSSCFFSRSPTGSFLPWPGSVCFGCGVRPRLRTVSRWLDTPGFQFYLSFRRWLSAASRFKVRPAKVCLGPCSFSPAFPFIFYFAKTIASSIIRRGLVRHPACWQAGVRNPGSDREEDSSLRITILNCPLRNFWPRSQLIKC